LGWSHSLYATSFYYISNVFLTMYRLVSVAGNESYNERWLIIRATIRVGIYGCLQRIAPIISIFVSLNSILREISSFSLRLVFEYISLEHRLFKRSVHSYGGGAGVHLSHFSIAQLYSTPFIVSLFHRWAEMTHITLFRLYFISLYTTIKPLT
jgi:hypothetical protein